MANGNDIGAAFAAFGAGYLGAKKEKKEQKREDDKWQAQLGISIANLRLAQEQEARMKQQFTAEVEAKKQTIARQGQEDANKGYMAMLEDHQDPVTAYQITQRTHGYAPVMSPEEGAMWQAQLLQGKVNEKKVMSAIESASAGNAAARAAAAQSAAMKDSAMQSAILPTLIGMAQDGKVPVESIPQLSRMFATGQLPPEVSGAMNETFRAGAMGKDFDPKPIQNLIDDGVIPLAKGAAIISAYRNGTILPDQDAEVSKLISSNKETVRVRAAADKLMEDSDVSPQVRAAVAADKTGAQATSLLEYAAEYGLKPKLDQSVVTNAINLRSAGADPNAALGGPAATVAAIAGAPQQADPSLAKDLFNLGAAPEAIQQGAANPNAFTGVLGTLTGKRDAEKGTSEWQKVAEFLNLPPQQRAAGMAGQDQQQQAIAATAVGFTTPTPDTPSQIFSRYNQWASQGNVSAQLMGAAMADPTGQTALKQMSLSGQGFTTPKEPGGAGSAARVPLSDYTTLIDDYGATSAEAIAAATDEKLRADIVARGKSKKGSDAVKDAAIKSGQLDRLRKNYINASFVEMKAEPDMLNPGKMVVAPVLDAEGNFVWKPGSEAAKANYDLLYKETVGMSNDIATGLR